MEKDEIESESKTPAQVLMKKIRENRKSLHIARIPDKAKESFIALAEEDFCGDYGMTLKWLIDDIPSQDMRLVIAKLEEFESRIQVLESAAYKGEETPNEHYRKCVMERRELERRLINNE